MNVSLKIHVNQSSSESSTYVFQVKFRFALWTQVTTPPPGQQSISISKYFTDTDGNSLTSDVDGFYNVSIVINPQGKATSTDPGNVVEIIVIRNNGTLSLSGTMKVIINISNDWTLQQPWSGSPTGNIDICVYKGSTPLGFPYSPLWPFNASCTSSGGHSDDE